MAATAEPTPIATFDRDPSHTPGSRPSPAPGFPPEREQAIEANPLICDLVENSDFLAAPNPGPFVVSNPPGMDGRSRID